MTNKQLANEMSILQEKCAVMERIIVALLREVQNAKADISEIADHNRRVTAAVVRVNKQLRQIAA